MLQRPGSPGKCGEDGLYRKLRFNHDEILLPSRFSAESSLHCQRLNRCFQNVKRGRQILEML
ncbi:MAG: hypothetical protein Q4D62_13820 [Planctomycetia bacterium]|nr:hypothetical protein [Planctomycetia bacterium]